MRPVFILFYNANTFFLAVNASMRWLNNVSGMDLIQISLLLIGQQGLVDFFSYRPFPSHWLEDCANFMPMLEENDQYGTNHSWCNTSIKPIHIYQ
jgi:hypothetical protein